MKISKLFHWLYALLMLLPIFAMGVTCLYAIFNKNAYKNYSGNDTIETTYITNRSFLEENNSYYFDSRNYTNFTDVTANTNQERIYFNDIEIISSYLPDNNIDNVRSIGFYKISDTSLLVYLYDENNIQIVSFNVNQYVLVFKFNYLSNNFINDTLFSNTTMFYSINNLQGHYIDNVFYYSVDKVKESPMFNWAYNSFLAVPIVYITNLFSIPSTHLVVELLSYWLAISIIWLVFDLIMYVPLLVHRWIDKGVLE